MKFYKWLEKKQYISKERFAELDPVLQSYLRDEHKEFCKREQKIINFKRLPKQKQKKIIKERELEEEREDAYQLLRDIGVPFLDGEPLGIG